MEVTVSGVPRQRRAVLQALVEGLRGRYSGALVVGRTGAVVVDGPAVDWAAPKLVAAQASGIPVVTGEWLEDSQLHGFLLCPAHYKISVGQPARRSSAASTSAAGPGPPPVSRSSPPPAAVPALAAGPAAAAASPRPAASPEVERLRGEAPAALPTGAPRFVDLPAGGGSPADTPGGKHTQERTQQQGRLSVVGPDPLRELLPSPSSPAAVPQRLEGLWEGLPPSPGLTPAASPLVADGPPESAGGRCCSPPQSITQEGALQAAGTPTARPHIDDAETAAAEAAPAGSAGRLQTRGEGCSGSSQTEASGTDSDTKVARFLSRMPQVTLMRGTGRPRLLPASIDSWCSSIGSNSGSSGKVLRSADGHGAAQRRASCSSGANSDRAWPALRAVRFDEAGAVPGVQAGLGEEGEEETGEQQERRRQPAGAPATNQPRLARQLGEAAGGASEAGSPAGAEPAEAQADSYLHLDQSAVPARWRTESVVRMRPPLVEARLPATTLIRLGPAQARPPSHATLDGIAERHGSGQGGQHPGPTFFLSAEALPANGPEMLFVAGDTSHGARILYDTAEDGSWLYALALVQSIYQLGGEAWMEHRYLFSPEDLRERPRWAAAVQGLALKPGELLLSAGSYHSPMHLICGEFWLSFPGRAQRVGQGHGGAAAAASPQQLATGAQRQPAYTCRRGFDAATGMAVPLRRALRGFAAVQ